MSDLSIERLDCGTLSGKHSGFAAGAPDTEITIPVPAWLIRHPKGLVLVDAGMHADLAAPGPYLDLISLFFGVGMSTDDTVTTQLEAADVAPSDIDVVVLTHLHFDHTGGLHQIPDARVLIQDAEWSAGADDDLAASIGYVADDYRLGHDVETLDGEHDIFGDGTITCLPTPGHTPGHQSVRVRLADREVVLCGDCAYFSETLQPGGALPPGGFDLELQAQSIARLRSLGDAGALLVPGHDPTTISALPSVLV